MRKAEQMFSLTLGMALCMGLFACASAPMSKSEIDAKRDEIRSMTKETLDKVYQQYPESKADIQSAAGYAVFGNSGFKLIFMGSNWGAGMAFNNADKKETYMKMKEMSPGLGLGVQKFRCVLIFETGEAFEKFVNSGWEFGGSTTAGLQTSTQGSGGRLGVSVSSGVRMYQLTEAGAIVGISIAGAKYYKDDELN
ncbi:MAG TPA: YSC84-related protein [Thermodesulfobacteriota bacterium]|nr:YSC84-related protein [Thermodesulfobacteriota bacterium]